MLILDKFFLKYEGGRGGQIDPPEKTTLKKPSLIRVKHAHWKNALSNKTQAHTKSMNMDSS